MFEDTWAIRGHQFESLWWWMDSGLQVIFGMLPRVYFVWRDLCNFSDFPRISAKFWALKPLATGMDDWLQVVDLFARCLPDFSWQRLLHEHAAWTSIYIYIYATFMAFHVPFSEWNYKFLHSNGFRNIAIWEGCSMWGPLDSKVGL